MPRTQKSALADGLLTFGARTLVDEDGRPVAEIASPLYRTVQTDLVRCPYPDARAGGEMNRSALRQMSASWPELLAAFSAMAGPDPTVADAWAAAATGISLPLLATQPVPRVTAALFKACLGLSQVFGAMLLTADGVADLPLTALGDAAGFFTALDEGKWLIGAQQVCAGTRPMFEAVFDALVGRRAPEGVCPRDLASAIDGLGRRPAAIIGLHVAHLCALQARAGAGEGGFERVEHPWLRAVYAVPDRPPGHALRLFATGRAPQAVVEYLNPLAPDLEARFSWCLSLSAG